MRDIGTTKRKPLTPTQRLKMFEAHGGKCCICKGQIIAGEKWIDEHIRPLALGGGNEIENRGPAHGTCAAGKTTADMAQIVKAKAQKRAALGIKAEVKQIESAPMPKAAKASKNINPLGAPRPMFEDIR
jgi:5-methylcytosine-specific restriction endonuclease McrA